MPRTALATVGDIRIAGLTPTFQAGDHTNGMSIPGNDGRMFLYIKNTGGAPITVTAVPAKTIGGLTITSPSVSVPATTGERLFGPFDPSIFNQAGGSVNIDLSASAGLTIALLRLP